MTVSGERSSCDAFATKSRRVRSTFFSLRHVANDREPLIGAVRDDLHVQPTRFVARRCDGDAVAGRRLQIRDEIGMAQQVVDAVTDVGRVIEAERAAPRPD